MSTGSEWRKSSYSDSTGGSCVEVRTAWRKSSYSDSTGGNCVEVRTAWRKSSYSTDTGGSCVEVGRIGDVQVRDTTDRGGPALAVSAAAWRQFTASLR